MDLPIEDVAELEQLCATYALKMTQGDIHYIIEHVCTADGTYSAFGETYGLEDWPSLVEAAPKGLFLTGTPVLELDGDTGSGEVPLLFVDQTDHQMRMGWYSDTYRRTENGWRLRTRTMTFLRRNGEADSGRPHDPRRPKPAARRSG
ncbi:nuclear transport factor 2 family protein [Actinomadura sp. 9N407]|uniref:nuclear transport factor 2 family protein n=1 Tax=Actinomadura sp. 9N407 TaxID=3375154 RepID=UPI0037B38027